MGKSSRKVQEINAGSMADIAFLLLIFFLVTTTIDQESGIPRKLPEKQDNPNPPEAKKRNVFQVLVNGNDDLLVNGEFGNINLLKDRCKEFIKNANNDPNLSEYTQKDIAGIGSYKVSKGVVMLQNDTRTTFDKYMQVQDVLTRAFNELRNELAKEKFGKTFDEMQTLEKSDEAYKARVAAIEEAIPITITESQPRKTQ